MAEHILIDDYLGQLGREVGRMRHAEDIITEVADHLLEAVAMHAQRGLDHVAAQRQALLEFGEPELVGTAFASTGSGGIAVPTQFTRRAGIALIVSSVLWLAGLAGLYISDVLDRTRPWEGSPQIAYGIGANTMTIAAILLVIGVAGLNRRHGGELGTLGRIAFWVGLPTAFLAQAPWAWGLWSAGLAIVGLTLAVALASAGLVPRTAAWMIGAGAAGVPAALWAFNLAEPEIEFGGGLPTAIAAIGLAVLCVGLAQVGGWLRSETPVDDPSHMATA